MEHLRPAPAHDVSPGRARHLSRLSTMCPPVAPGTIRALARCALRPCRAPFAPSCPLTRGREGFNTECTEDRAASPWASRVHGCLPAWGVGALICVSLTYGKSGRAHTITLLSRYKLTSLKAGPPHLHEGGVPCMANVQLSLTPIHPYAPPSGSRAPRWSTQGYPRAVRAP